MEAHEVRDSLRRTGSFSFIVPSWTKHRVIEDLLRALREHAVDISGYDIHPDPGGCRVELFSDRECMFDAESAHVDLELHVVGECIDHYLDDDEIADAFELTLVEKEELPALYRGVAFSWAEAVLPRRYTSEEFGDALEEIQHKQRAGCSPWWVRLKVASTILWVLWHIAVDEYGRYRRRLRGGR